MAYTLQLEHKLEGELHRVYPAILDMRLFGEHHPYMKEVSLLQSTNDFCEYRVKEFVWIFGFIPQWPEYTAKVFELEKHTHIQYTSLVKGAVDLKIDFLFADQNPGSTLITENIHLSGNKLVCNILLGAMKKAHPALFNNLKLHIANKG